jgi:hypothetical protein
MASNGSTAIPQSTTLPDISLGSLGSSFRSADEDSFSATPRKREYSLGLGCQVGALWSPPLEVEVRSHPPAVPSFGW